MEKRGNYLYEELTYKIIGCAYDSFERLGVGFDEVRYHKVFHECLQREALNARYKVPFKLYYRNKIIANFEIDEIVDDKVIVEIKCIQTDFIPENYAQLMTYLKTSKLRLGLLINFGLHKVYLKRIIFDEQRKSDLEEWDNNYFRDTSVQHVIESVVGSVRRVDKEIGVAYHEKIYKSALALEFRENSIPYNDIVYIETHHNNIQFRPFKTDYWLIHDSLLFGVLAAQGRPRTYDLYRMRSYLKKLKITHGLIACWTTRNLQLYGILEQ